MEEHIRQDLRDVHRMIQRLELMTETPNPETLERAAEELHTLARAYYGMLENIEHRRGEDIIDKWSDLDGELDQLNTQPF
jgi:hypothetical protein